VRKIPTLFKRDESNPSRVTDVVTPGCEWVFDDPEAVPTRKYDGTAVMMMEGGTWWARRIVKPGQDEPRGFAEVEVDPNTGYRVGWIPAETSSWAKHIDEAIGYLNSEGPGIVPGTFELCGPKVNGNPECWDRHMLIRHDTAAVIRDHGETVRVGNAAEVEALLRGLAANGVEGVVWHHPDGRRAKNQAKDYGIRVSRDVAP
jgi:hypothetical protein